MFESNELENITVPDELSIEFVLSPILLLRFHSGIRVEHSLLTNQNYI